MSKKSDEIAKRRAALGWSVISNEAAPSTQPPSKVRSAAEQMKPSGFSRNQAQVTPGNMPRSPGNGVITSHSEYAFPVRAGVPPEPKPSSLTLASVGGDETLEAKATQFAGFLEQYHQANVGPFSFLGDVPIPLHEMPETNVLNRAVEMLREKGWSVSVSLPTAGEAGSVTMMDKHHTGF